MKFRYPIHMSFSAHRFQTLLALFVFACVGSSCGGKATDAIDGSTGTDSHEEHDGEKGVTCEDYCSTVMQACTEDNQLYPDEFECRAYCQSIAVWEGGDLDDSDQNNIGCRMVFAQKALNENPVFNCKAASPLGGGICGSWCDNYCNLMMRHCVAESEVFPDMEACASECAEYEEFGSVGEEPNNTLQCRLHYVKQIPFEAEEACSVAGPSGSPDCLPTEKCTDYCSILEEKCTGVLQQFQDNQTCLDTCLSSRFWSPGSPGETSGDSRECRFNQASLVGGENNEVHCMAAGPSGGDICGSWCGVMCHLEEVNCLDSNSVYNSVSDCVESCSAMQIGSPFDPPNNNTVQCRIGYLGAPSISDPETNCIAAGVDGGGLCQGGGINQCNLYCDKVMANCTGTNSQYPDVDSCLKQCVFVGAWPAAGALDLDGNSLGCRSHHAELAQHAPEAHCAAAGVSGGNVCGSWCDVMCGLHESVCIGGNAVYPGLDPCKEACETMAVQAEASTAQGNSVQCRIEALSSLAFEDPAQHCNVAGLEEIAPCVGSVSQPCEDYCTSYGEACPEQLFGFQDQDDCIEYCKNTGAWPVGTVGETQNTIQCRIEKVALAVELASEEKEQACLSAGPGGNGVCGSLCDNYCDLVLSHCVQENLLFGSSSNCHEFCASYPTDGNVEDLSGDSVQCRLNHAMQTVLTPETSCSSASFLGGGICVSP